jgi:hypothetical protein
MLSVRNKIPKMKYATLLLLSLSLVLFSCKKKKDTVSTPTPVETPVVAVDVVEIPVANDQDTLIYYRRGACFGMCPIFDMVVYKNGRAVYHGKNYVDRIGDYQTNIDLAALQKIKSVADQIGYFSLQESYDNPHVTDLPTTVTIIADENGKLKSVANRYKGPAGLRSLYEALDKMTEEQDWKLLTTKE